MARYGFIHDKLDIKFLILYLMARMAASVDLPTLADLTMCDPGVDYFAFTEAVSELVKTGHLSMEEDRYIITDKGRRDGGACESSLPYSVKRRCSPGLAHVNSVLRRDAQVRAETTARAQGGGFTIKLSLDDEAGNLLSVELLCPTQEQAAQICERFREKPEQIYNGLLAALLEQEEPL